jgi:hypothetical protein
VCPTHGRVDPLHPPVPAEALDLVAARADVPVWVPDPPPVGWQVTGLRYAGHERTGWTAVVVAVSGPNPLGGDADLLLIAEEPGVGVGCWYAGLPGPDPGAPVGRPPDAEISVAHHNAHLWACPGTLPDRAAYVGEAAGLWLWVVAVPAAAELLLLERLRLADAHDGVLALRRGPIGSVSMSVLSGPPPSAG